MKRRASLALLGLGTLAGGCAKPDRRSRVALAGLASGGRLVVEHDGAPVEVSRTDAGLVARSLLCSHYGCRVEWRAAAERYVCACHQGAFDAAGRPVAGPPTQPLRLLPITVSGDTALVGDP